MKESPRFREVFSTNRRCETVGISGSTFSSNLECAYPSAVSSGYNVETRDIQEKREITTGKRGAVKRYIRNAMEKQTG
jgi:hypothetical protein